jgi:hydroxymethylglutaryl-CoA lyase
MAALATPGTLADRASMSLAGLVLNARGLDGAIETGVDEINVVVVSTDTYATRNQSRTTAELIDTWHQVGERARSHGLRTTVTLAAAFGCPFEGELPEGRLTSVARAILQVRPDEFALADSIGVAAPTDIERGIDVVRSLDADVPLRCHFHNTRNTGIANVVAALRHGVRTFDASLGGIGGCPFAPDATGNVPTEDVLYLLHRMGIDTGIDLDAIIGIVPWLRSVIGHDTPGLVSRAGNFPPR